MTRPGEPSLRDLSLLVLGAALGDETGKCRTWLLATLSRDDFAGDVERRLFDAISQGRGKGAELIKAWGETLGEKERAIEPIKRLTVKKAIEAAVPLVSVSLRVQTLGDTDAGRTIQTLGEHMARLQKLADAEAALRPQPKEEATV